MHIKSRLSLFSASVTRKCLKLLNKGGTTLPGVIAMKIDPSILKAVTQNVTTIFVTGTNGKTTTTSMIYQALKEDGKDIFSNTSGANMIQGITGCFIENYQKNAKHRFAVIEVDEASFIHVTKHIAPDYLLMTNVFRDQLDRYGEVHTTLNIILEGLKKSPSTKVILNGDEPLFNHMNIQNELVYFGFNVSLNTDQTQINIDNGYCNECQKALQYHFNTYSQLGNYYCDCGNSRPPLKYYVDELTKIETQSSIFKVNQQPYQMPLSGLYNIYNALACISVCSELNCHLESIQASISRQEAKFGRQEILNIDQKELMFFLIKNPTGFNQSLETISLDPHTSDHVMIINDQYADGIDVSWLYDVQFEHYQKRLNSGSLMVSGSRAYDIAIRLSLFNDHVQIYQDFNVLLNEIKKSPNNKVYCFVTYSAMLSFRKFLQAQGYIKDYWK